MVSALLTQHFLNLQKKVLLIEINGKGKALSSLGYRHSDFGFLQLKPNFGHLNLDKALAIKEYALMILKFKSLYQLVFHNSMVQTFVDAIPALEEVCLIGKIWHTEQKMKEGDFSFDVMVIDSHPTGHGLSLLTTIKDVYNIVPFGPLKTQTEKMYQMLEDPFQTSYHIVTIPEQMIINETVELYQTMRDDPSLKRVPDFLFINKMMPSIFSSNEEPLLSQGIENSVRHLARKYLETTQVQKKLTHELAMKIPIPTIPLPFFEMNQDFIESKMIHNLAQSLFS